MRPLPCSSSPHRNRFAYVPAGAPFGLGKKRKGRGRSKRKNAFAVRERDGFQASLCPRRGTGGSLEVPDSRFFSFRCRCPGVPRERQRKKETGASPISHFRAIHAAGFVFPDFQRTSPPRGVLFFWTVHGPFSFRQERKENGGCILPAKPANPAPLRRVLCQLLAARNRSASSSSSPALSSSASVTRLPPVIRASSAFRASRSSRTTWV